MAEELESSAPVMMAAIWPILVLSGGFLATRLFIRFRAAALWMDDYILLSAWVSILEENFVKSLASFYSCISETVY